MRENNSFSLSRWLMGTLFGLLVVNLALLAAVFLADWIANQSPQFTVSAFTLLACLILIGLAFRGRATVAATAHAARRRPVSVAGKLRAGKTMTPAIHSIVIFKRVPKEVL